MFYNNYILLLSYVSLNKTSYECVHSFFRSLKPTNHFDGYFGQREGEEEKKIKINVM